MGSACGAIPAREEGSARLWWPLLLLLLAALLRLVGLQARGLWLDEAVSIEIASRSFADIASGSGFDKHTPPFYYLLLHCWLAVAPATVLGIRLLSVVTDLLNVLLVYRTFGRQYSRRVGLISAVLYSCSPFSIYFAQEGRMYPLLVLLTLVTYSFALQILGDIGGKISGKAGRVLWVIPVMIIGLYTHYYYALFLVLLTLFVVVRLWRKRSTMMFWLSSVAVAGLLFAPWCRTVLALFEGGGQAYRRFLFSVLPYTLLRFTVGYGVLPLTHDLKQSLVSTIVEHLALLLPVVLVVGCVLAVAARVVWQQRKQHNDLLLLVLLLAGLPGLALALSLSAPMLSERYLVIIFPLFLAVLARAPWGRWPERQGAVAFLWPVLQIAALGLGGYALVQHYLAPHLGTLQLREAAHSVMASPHECDCVVVYPRCYAKVMRYYLPEGTTIGALSGSFNQRLFRRCRRFWLIEAGGGESVRLSLIARGCEPLAESFFPAGSGVRVTLLERSNPTLSTPGLAAAP